MYAWRTGNKNEKYVKRSVEINWDETEEKKKSEKEKMTKWIWTTKDKNENKKYRKNSFYEQKNSFMLIDTIKIKMLRRFLNKLHLFNIFHISLHFLLYFTNISSWQLFYFLSFHQFLAFTLFPLQLYRFLTFFVCWFLIY